MTEEDYLKSLFHLENRVAVVTGGGGVLCSAIGQGLARVGARLALLDISIEAAEKAAVEIRAAGGQALVIACDVLDKASLEAAAQAVLQEFGRVDMLVNGAGGNRPQATTGPERSFFELPAEAINWVFNLNFIGALLPCQVFGQIMAQQSEGAILNIASMNAFRPLTRIPAYSAAKSALVNFTQWLAVHMAQEYSSKIRINAIAPGFLLTAQNRYLLIDEASGELTRRGKKIIEHTPQGRFQTPEELLSAAIWLLSPGASAVTGIVVPVDGGFSAYSGV